MIKRLVRKIHDQSTILTRALLFNWGAVNYEGLYRYFRKSFSLCMKFMLSDHKICKAILSRGVSCSYVFNLQNESWDFV